QCNSRHGTNRLNTKFPPRGQRPDVVTQSADKYNCCSDQYWPPGGQVGDSLRIAQPINCPGRGESESKGKSNNKSSDARDRNRMDFALARQIDGPNRECKPSNERTKRQGDEKRDQEKNWMVNQSHATFDGGESVVASKDGTADDVDTR